MVKPRHYLNSLILCALCFITGCSSSSHGDYLRIVPRAERKGLAVLNFFNASPAGKVQQYQSWVYGIPAMLTTDLETIGLFNLVNRERLNDILQEQQLQVSGLVDPATAVQMGRLIAAHYILTGSFGIMGERLRIETQVYSVESGVQLGATSVEGETANFFLLEKQLVVKLTSYLEAMLSGEEINKLSARIETRSVQASLNNYAGEMALLQAKNLSATGQTKEAQSARESAKQNFETALNYDPAYQRARDNLRKLLMGVPLTI